MLTAFAGHAMVSSNKGACRKVSDNQKAKDKLEVWGMMVQDALCCHWTTTMTPAASLMATLMVRLSCHTPSCQSVHAYCEADMQGGHLSSG